MALQTLLGNTLCLLLAGFGAAVIVAVLVMNEDHWIALLKALWWSLKCVIGPIAVIALVWWGMVEMAKSGSLGPVCAVLDVAFIGWFVWFAAKAAIAKRRAKQEIQ